MDKKLSYEEWRKVVNRTIALKYLGITLDDLPDVMEKDWYEDGMSPKAAANKAVRLAKEF